MMLKQAHPDVRRYRSATERRRTLQRSVPLAAYEALKRLIRDCLPLLLAVAGYPSRAEREHQQREERHRQSNSHGQRLDGAAPAAPVAQEKVKPGKEAAYDTHQDENDG